MNKRYRLGVVFAGGGTGGHIQPNLAIAEQLAVLIPESVRGTFVTSERSIDAKVLADEAIEGLGFDQLVSPAKPIAMKPMALARFVLNWGGSVRAGRRAIRELKETCDRVVVVSTGGFVSPGVAMGARAEGVPSVLVNLDAVPGKANRLMQRWATRQLTSAPTSDARLERIAPIVRRRMLDPPSQEEARAHFGFDVSRHTLLVTGGSQGAQSVNDFVVRALKELKGDVDLASWQVIHQCGKDAEESLTERYDALGVPAWVGAYIERMDLAFAASDAAVTRGGAGTIADLWATRTPALVLPYPYHTDEHQKVNAKELAEAGGVSVGSDRIEPGANVRENLEKLRKLLNPDSRREMSVAIKGLGAADGARSVALIVLELAEVSASAR
ncbi:MAG: UDP-N-acetylglucosamine--N-acetylmuramyl-(pentapeptide) pyrophosphoryl-undecaprenol N-acetylglucosamine transferase [Phycisphaera sp.]|nr:MAG: UDP-N-acetylglucosamine--N-acetylmuramyl-(pentapeptide) pyrophosphoryl-undecaprenol N-acetylglucosamine transferase [Phycisphaera sp.]